MHPRPSAPSVYELPLGSIERFVCGPVPARLMSSTPPVIFPVPSAWKLPATATPPFASNPFIRYAKPPFIADSRPVGHDAAAAALTVIVREIVLVSSGDSESPTLPWKLWVPAIVGVPTISPLLPEELISRPGGIVPGLEFGGPQK